MNLRQKKAELEKQEIKKAIDKCETQAKTAETLGISRMSLYRKMVRYEMGTFYENKMQKPAENK